MGKGKTGAYPTTTSNSALWGSSTTNGSGTTFKPTDWQNDLMSTTGDNLNNTLKEYLNPTYQSEEYQTQKEQRQRQQAQAYDSGVLSPLASRGLMRSSGLQSATNAFNETLANQEAGALAGYKQSKLTDLSTLLGLSTDLYNYSQGENKLSSSLANAIANYNLQNQAMSNASSSALYSTLGGAIGTIGGAALGGPVGASIGGKMGGAAGKTL